jgi:hypothetical protein
MLNRWDKPVELKIIGYVHIRSVEIFVYVNPVDTKYTEFQAFSPVVRIGSPTPHPPPPLVPGGDTLAWGGGGGAGGASLGEGTAPPVQ